MIKYIFDLKGSLVNRNVNFNVQRAFKYKQAEVKNIKRGLSYVVRSFHQNNQDASKEARGLPIYSKVLKDRNFIELQQNLRQIN